MNDSTTISITSANADRLHSLKDRGDTYNDVVGRLLDHETTGTIDTLEDKYPGVTAEEIFVVLSEFTENIAENDDGDRYIDDLNEYTQIRKYLQMLYVLTRPEGIDLSGPPALTFDTNSWELVEGPDENITLRKNGVDSNFDEIIVGSADD